MSPKKFKRSLIRKSKKNRNDSESVDPELAKLKSAKRSERKSILSVIAVLIILIILLGSVITIRGTDKTSQLSAYGERWNDISKFRNSIINIKDINGRSIYQTSSIVSSPTVLKDVENITNKNPKDTLYVAIGIEKKFSTDEVRAIYNYVIDGGSAIIADDFGNGNSFFSAAEKIDSSFNIRFSGSQLWDENYEIDPKFVKINVNRADSRFFEGIILLNDPTALTRGSSSEKWYGRTLVTSSSKGWIDINGDGKPSPEESDEQLGKKPIIHELPVGMGKLVFISDPSLFINDMWVREDNSEFAIELVKYLLPNTDSENFKRNMTKLVIFDESLHMQDNVFNNARLSLYQGLVIFTTDTQLAILLGILALLFLGVLIIVVDDPPQLRHKFNIHYFNLHELKKSTITAKDTDRIRYIYLERLRITQGLTVAEFKELSYDELYNMIKDTDLVDFALDWDKKYYGEDLEKILLKIRDAF